ncbi:hypothetical protein [Bacillus sp. UMB0893]|uniref:hypothetical protein n=1 Tax=Bacillus sp. UMB0893 TaxID=2066053 RepID=UPI000C76697F|nr:hypothetical protein [Bacillus sp. UMB0893]PLR66314.1 hypothetical protein CYJ36_19680 [Bacillus sp. UMB0893]
MTENCFPLSGGFQDIFIPEQNKVVRLSQTLISSEYILQEIEWVNFLYHHGDPVPKTETTLRMKNERISASFEYIPGDPIDVTNASHWNEEMFEG